MGEDTNNKTIEHPTDIEDCNDGDGDSEFEVINNSPDAKLKSIDVDESFCGKEGMRRNRNDGDLKNIEKF